MTTDKDTKALIKKLEAALAEYDRYDPYISNERIMKQAYEIIEESREAVTILRAQQAHIKVLEAQFDQAIADYNRVWQQRDAQRRRAEKAEDRAKDLEEERDDWRKLHDAAQRVLIQKMEKSDESD